MSKTTFGLRKVAFAGLATALALGGTLVGVSSASAAPDGVAGEIPDNGNLLGFYDIDADDPVPNSPDVPTDIAAGTTGPAADVTYFLPATDIEDNDFLTFAVQTENAPFNQCLDATGKDAVGYANAPTVTLSYEDGSSVATLPSILGTPALTSSSLACDQAGIKDVFTVTFDEPPFNDTANDIVQITLSNINYKVGAAVPAGEELHIERPRVVGSDRVVNAIVRTGDVSIAVPRQAALPGSVNNLLKTITYDETTAGSLIKRGTPVSLPGGGTTYDAVVELTLGQDARFPDGMSPTVTVNAPYTATAIPLNAPQNATNPEGGASQYRFVLHYTDLFISPQPKLHMTIDGLLVDVDDVTAASTTPAAEGGPVPAPNTQNNGHGAGDELNRIIAINSAIVGTNAQAPGNLGTFAALNVIDYDGRWAGADRYETAARIYADVVADNKLKKNLGRVVQGNEAVLATGENFPDALSASFLAGALNGNPNRVPGADREAGILLTKTDSLPQATENALINNSVTNVYIVGGPGAVSQAVEEEIRNSHIDDNPFDTYQVTVKRIAGDDRYSTNAEINRFAYNLDPGNVDIALVASGEVYPDALALGPIAYASDGHMPLILTKGAALGQDAADQVADFDPNYAVIAGGTGVVSDAVKTALEAGNSFGPVEVSRLAGQDRAGTSAKIAEWATEGVQGLPVFTQTPVTPVPGGPAVFERGFVDPATQNHTDPRVYVAYANGQLGFADALAAGPLGGVTSTVILLGDTPTDAGDAVTEYLGDKTLNKSGNAGDHVHKVFGLGGNAVTTLNLLKDVAASIEELKPVAP